MKFAIAAAAICGGVTYALPSPPANLHLAARDGPVMTFTPVPFDEADAKVKEANKKPLIPLPADFGGETSLGTCGNLQIRTEWRLLSGAQQDAYLNAINCLLKKPASGRYQGSTNRYEDFAWVHAQEASRIHQTGLFFAWHRYFLHAFQGELRSQCGWSGTLPWFDETDYPGNFANAPPFSSDKYGWIPTSGDGNAVCMASTGVFKGLRVHIGPGGGIQERCLSRKLDEGASSQITKAFFDSCKSANDYWSFHQCFEQGPHAYGHIALGGTDNQRGNSVGIMSDAAASPGDPAFYLHHAFVDRAWRIWENVNTGRRLSEIAGNLAGGGSVNLDTTLEMRGLIANRPVRDVMDTTNSMLCYKYNV